MRAVESREHGREDTRLGLALALLLFGLLVGLTFWSEMRKAAHEREVEAQMRRAADALDRAFPFPGSPDGDGR
jgi:hypothetical protein